jgi:hypothetical protein
MPKLTKNGVTVYEADTRADCIVAAFRLNCVYDQHSRKRNQLLPGVKVEGQDYEGEAVEIR